ncbi:hypothetical protein BGZ60DRAFT_551406 [Tricladium varicosporioides]|nr:hypothetical protein BGZ60DRAFT_551406 [Hymenoscyphus varicosporioides]
MYFKKIISLVAFTALVRASPFVEPSTYLTTVAPDVLARLSAYRTAHPKLTNEQLAYLEKATNVVLTMDTSRKDAIKAEGFALFNTADATFLLTGKEVGELERALQCNCATSDSYCDSGTWCSYNYEHCNFHRGCGTLGLYKCDGMCIQNI